MSRRVTLGLAFVLLYAFAILSIGLTREWELLHEDNGALHTTLALSHVRLGLGRTRAHDYFFEPKSGLEGRYGAHPPGTALALAGAFWLTGSDTPAVARLVAIAFHLGSIALMIVLLCHVLDPLTALIGGALMATLPMGAFFGRMVNYEALCLFAILMQLLGYVLWSRTGSRRGLALIAAGIVVGGLVDWPAFFFAGAMTIAAAVTCARRRPVEIGPVALLAAATGGMAVLDVAHLWSVAPAGARSLRLVEKLSSGPTLGGSGALDPLGFLVGQLEIARRYYTDAGLISAVVVAAALLVRRRPIAARLFIASDPALLQRLLLITGGAAVAYVLVAPGWARIHAYWQFYALPYVVLAMLLVGHGLFRLGRERGEIWPRALLAALVVDAAVGSATTLHYRHTTPSAHTVRQVSDLRARTMLPAYLEGKPGER